MYRRTIATGAALALLVAVPAFGQAIPKEMSWTAYDTGSSGFNIAVAIGQQFKNVLGTDVRVLPSGKASTVARIVTADGDLDQAVAGQSITLTLDDEIDVLDIRA